VQELRASTPPLIAETELLSANHDLVAVQERSRLRTKAHAIHQDLEAIVGFVNGDLAIGRCPDQHVAQGDTRASQHDHPLRVATDCHFPRLDGVSAATYFEI
jgi:hypothetical protein